ncbi:hypothetical protein M8J77_019746 [Diaphorina citri]|nr:hypothetical protein M8J77_019746 [Diaphorina citri]
MRRRIINTFTCLQPVCLVKKILWEDLWEEKKRKTKNQLVAESQGLVRLQLQATLQRCQKQTPHCHDDFQPPIGEECKEEERTLGEKSDETHKWERALTMFLLQNLLDDLNSTQFMLTDPKSVNAHSPSPESLRATVSADQLASCAVDVSFSMLGVA